MQAEKSVKKEKQSIRDLLRDFAGDFLEQAAGSQLNILCGGSKRDLRAQLEKEKQDSALG